MEDKYICSVCKEEILYSYKRIYNKEGDLFCLICFHKIYVFCSECNEQTKKEDAITSQQDNKYCTKCYDDLFTVCSGCDNELLKNDARIPPENISDGEIYCEECFWEVFTPCSGCDRIILIDNAYSSEDYHYCEECWGRTHIEGLNEWDYKPEPEFLFTKRDSKIRKTELFFGIELEVENVEGISTNKEEIARLPGFTYAKEDSSLDAGFEIVSHPATWNWLKENKEKWESILEIRERGFRSYNTFTCGIHIHLSKDAFGGIHLFKFLKLFYENPAFVLAVSCRRESALRSYASITGEGGEGLIYKAKTKDSCGAYRHTAINLANFGTVEVRIFRGTLDPAGFWRNLEFTKSAFEFTKQCSIRRTSISEYLKYIIRNRKSYRNLVEFLERKGLLKIHWQSHVLPKKEEKKIQMDEEVDSITYSVAEEMNVEWDGLT